MLAPTEASLSRAAYDATAPGETARATRPNPRTKSGSILPALVFSAACLAALAYGWSVRTEEIITPEEGTGYWLGIAGSLMMLLLMLYPLRKRLGRSAKLGPVKHWFRIHMMLGIVGPLLILFHANFSLHSLNASVATMAMLIVVGSGIIGRYLHARVHAGLYGRRLEAQELLEDARRLHEDLGRALGGDTRFAPLLAGLSDCLKSERPGLFASIATSLSGRLSTPRAAARLKREVRLALKTHVKARTLSKSDAQTILDEVASRIDAFTRAIRRANAFAVYARLLALWHHLHLPLFILLGLTAVLHVVAVHTY